jgi:hypothetical protein
MADIIGLNEIYSGTRLNEPDVWERFLDFSKRRRREGADA